MTTVQDRYNAAVAAIREQGVVFTENVMTCCRSCADFNDVGLPNRESFDAVPFVWHFGGQGNEIAWEDGLPYNVEEVYEECSCYEDVVQEEEEDEDGNVIVEEEREMVECDFCLNGPSEPRRTPATNFWLNHGGPDVKAAAVAAQAFRDQGFTVEWDGTEMEAVGITLN